MKRFLKEVRWHAVFLWAVMLTVATFVLLIAWGSNEKTLQDYTLTEIEEIDIYPSSEGKSIELVSVNNEPHYKYLVMNADGSYETLTLKTKKAKIIYIDENESERITTFRKNYQSLDKFLLMFAQNKEAHYEYKIYVKQKVQ